MNTAHLHLLLNHVPVLGAIGLLGMFTLAFVRRDAALSRLLLAISVILAVGAFIVFLTGEPAEELIEHVVGVETNAVEPHEEAALVATIAFAVFGAAALVALIAYWRRALPRWIAGSAIVATLVVSGLMGWTANLGGKIRHTETGAAAGATETDRENEDGEERPGTPD